MRSIATRGTWVGVAAAVIMLVGPAPPAVWAATLSVWGVVSGPGCPQAAMRKAFTEERAAVVAWAPRYALGHLPGVRAEISSQLTPPLRPTVRGRPIPACVPDVIDAQFTTTARPESVAHRLLSVARAFLVLDQAMGPPVVGADTSFSLMTLPPSRAGFLCVGFKRLAAARVVRVGYGFMCRDLAGTVTFRSVDNPQQRSAAAQAFARDIAKAAATW